MKPDQPSVAVLPAGMTVKARTRDISGVKFGRLTAIEVVGKHTNNSLIWRCKCDCGNEVDRTSASLGKRDDGAISSCGCYLREINRERLAGAKPWNSGKRYALLPAGAVYANKKAWSAAVRREKGDSCERCGWAEAICDVHHRIPKSEGGLNTIENGIVLCPNCHRLVHERGQHVLAHLATASGAAA